MSMFNKFIILLKKQKQYMKQQNINNLALSNKNLNQSNTSLFDTSLSMMSSSQKIQCPFGCKGYGYCLDCNQCSIVCVKEDCKCYQHHIKNNCQNIKRISNFNKKLQAKVQQSTILQKISNINQQMIDILSSLQQDIKKRYQFFGLNQADRQIATKIINYAQKKQVITSKDFIKYANQYQKQQQKWFTQQTKIFNKKIELVKQQIIDKLYNIQKLIYHEHMQRTKNIQDFLLFNSTILKQNKDYRQQMLQMLKDLGNIKRIQKLYSIDKDKFNLQYFYKRCNGHKNMLYLIKNDNIKNNNYKVYGGYCPVEININNSNYYVDDSLKSFIFDLGQKKKSKQIKNQKTMIIFNTNKKHSKLLVFGDQQNPNLIISQQSKQTKKLNYISFDPLNQSNSIYTHIQRPMIRYGYYLQYQEIVQENKVLMFEAFQITFKNSNQK